MLLFLSQQASHSSPQLWGRCCAKPWPLGPTCTQPVQKCQKSPRMARSSKALSPVLVTADLLYACCRGRLGEWWLVSLPCVHSHWACCHGERSYLMRFPLGWEGPCQWCFMRGQKQSHCLSLNPWDPKARISGPVPTSGARRRTKVAYPPPFPHYLSAWVAVSPLHSLSSHDLFRVLRHLKERALAHCLSSSYNITWQWCMTSYICDMCLLIEWKTLSSSSLGGKFTTSIHHFPILEGRSAFIGKVHLLFTPFPSVFPPHPLYFSITSHVLFS